MDVKQTLTLTCLLGFPLLFLGASASPSRSASSNGLSEVGCKEGDAEDRKDTVLVSRFFSEGVPASMVSIDLNIYHNGYPEKPRLAVLRADGLHIFRIQRDVLIDEFSLQEPPVPWDTMHSFPSKSKLFGVVLWASEEHAYASATVVCHVDGRFKVVFRGDDVEFADLDFDGIPEILTEEYASQDAKEPITVTIWTWKGKEYVKVARVPPGQLWSKQIV